MADLLEELEENTCVLKVNPQRKITEVIETHLENSGATPGFA